MKRTLSYYEYKLLRVLGYFIRSQWYQEWLWEQRNKYDKYWYRSHFMFATIKSKQSIADVITAYNPRSVLEIGCCVGTTLFLLQGRLTNTKFYGIDIAEDAVRFGNNHAIYNSYGNVEIICANGQELEMFGDKSIELVFTDATLSNISPNGANKIISEIKRIAQKTIIFNEWHGNQQCSKGYFVYDFSKWFNNMRYTKLDSSSGSWNKFGYLMEINL